MIRAIVLNKEVKCEIICQEVQKLINEYNKENGNSNNTILVIQMKGIVDSHEDSGPLRLIDKKESV